MLKGKKRENGQPLHTDGSKTDRSKFHPKVVACLERGWLTKTVSTFYPLGNFRKVPDNKKGKTFAYQIGNIPSGVLISNKMFSKLPHFDVAFPGEEIKPTPPGKRLTSLDWK